MRSRLLIGLSVVVCSLASVGALAAGAPSAWALTTITVDSAADGTATPSHCLPTPVAGACTLRDAIAAASSGGAGAGDDVSISVAPSISAITLTGGQLEYDGGTGGAHALSLNTSAAVTVTQTTADRIFEISGSGPFSVSGFTLTGGAPDGAGGAIDAAGDVTVIDSALVSNQAGDGGAINVVGALTIVRSTIADNQASSFGGAVEVEDDGLVTIVDSTISGNTAGALGGGLAGTADVTLVYSTLAGNSAPANQGANIDANGGVLTSFGSVIALPDGGVNCQGFGSTTSHGFNAEDDAAASCGFGAGPGDLPPGTASGLAALADNGGPGPTRLPQAGSALLDAIPVASCQADGASGVSTDERGVSRPQGSGCDIGAVEVEVAAPTPPGPPSPPVTPAIPVAPRFTG